VKKEFAVPLKKLLTDLGMSVFLDKDALPENKSCSHVVIESALRRCRVAVVVFDNSLFDPERTVLHAELRIIAQRFIASETSTLDRCVRRVTR